LETDSSEYQGVRDYKTIPNGMRNYVKFLLKSRVTRANSHIFKYEEYIPKGIGI